MKCVKGWVCCFSHILPEEPTSSSILDRTMLWKHSVPVPSVLLKRPASRNCNLMLPPWKPKAPFFFFCLNHFFSFVFHSGDVQRAIPPRTNGVLPLRQRHAHQESERLGDAQRGQSREPERVDVARRPSPGPGVEPREKPYLQQSVNPSRRLSPASSSTNHTH